MAHAYGDDLRRKFLEAYDAKEGSLRVLAKRFHVSADWAFKVHADRKRTGSFKRVLQARHGSESRVDREQIARLLAIRPDMALFELQAELLAVTGFGTSVPHLCRVVRQMGLGRKKSRSTRPSATAKRTVAGARRSSTS